MNIMEFVLVFYNMVGSDDAVCYNIPASDAKIEDFYEVDYLRLEKGNSHFNELHDILNHGDHIEINVMGHKCLMSVDFITDTSILMSFMDIKE